MTITQKRKTGDFGEDIACEYLRRRGYEVICRNYLRKWGEIDIVAKINGIIRFVEVKSVTCEISDNNVPCGTYRPEENMHPQKLRRLSKAIQTYLLEEKLGGVAWQLDLITVRIDMKKRIARAEMMENIVI